MSRKKKHAQHEEEMSEAWLLPYSDLMTLLLAVFIVLFAVSKVDAKKAEDMSQEFAGQMMTEGYVLSMATGTGGGTGDVGGGIPIVIDLDDALKDFLGEYELRKLEDLKSEVDASLQDGDMSGAVSTSIDMRGLVIRMNNAILFDSGSAEIQTNEETLIKLAQLINSLDNYVRIEGHTDTVPINSSIYPSNWELSSARATRVVQLFIEKCGFSPDKLVAVGYGEYRPVADNGTPEGRAKNRRIDIIVLSEKYNSLEEQFVE